MKTILVKPSITPLNRGRTVTEKTEPSVFYVTGSEKTDLPSPEVVCDGDNDVDRKGKQVDDDNIQVLWSDFRDNTTMHGLKNANLKQRHRLRWWDIRGGPKYWTLTQILLVVHFMLSIKKNSIYNTLLSELTLEVEQWVGLLNLHFPFFLIVKTYRVVNQITGIHTIKVNLLSPLTTYVMFTRTLYKKNEVPVYEGNPPPP